MNISIVFQDNDPILFNDMKFHRSESNRKQEDSLWMICIRMNKESVWCVSKIFLRRFAWFLSLSWISCVSSRWLLFFPENITYIRLFLLLYTSPSLSKIIYVPHVFCLQSSIFLYVSIDCELIIILIRFSLSSTARSPL